MKVYDMLISGRYSLGARTLEHVQWIALLSDLLIKDFNGYVYLYILYAWGYASMTYILHNQAQQRNHQRTLNSKRDLLNFEGYIYNDSPASILKVREAVMIFRHHSSQSEGYNPVSCERSYQTRNVLMFYRRFLIIYFWTKEGSNKLDNQWIPRSGSLLEKLILAQLVKKFCLCSSTKRGHAVA